jgi:hypothetical protein
MHLQVMLDATIMVDLVFDRDGESRGHELDHWQSPREDSASSLPPLGNMAEGGIRKTEICAMTSAIEMHTVGLTTGAKSMSTLSKNNKMRGTMTIMVPSMTNLTDSAPLKEGATQEESQLSSTIWRWYVGP